MTHHHVKDVASTVSWHYKWAILHHFTKHARAHTHTHTYPFSGSWLPHHSLSTAAVYLILQQLYKVYSCFPVGFLCTHLGVFTLMPLPISLSFPQYGYRYFGRRSQKMKSISLLFFYKVFQISEGFTHSNTLQIS